MRKSWSDVVMCYGPSGLHHFFDQQKIHECLMVNPFDRDRLSDLWWTKSLQPCSREEEFNGLLACDAELVFQHRKSLLDGFRPCTRLRQLDIKATRFLAAKKSATSACCFATCCLGEISCSHEATGFVILRCCFFQKSQAHAFVRP